MSIPCTDRDLLGIEPGVFLDEGPASQRLIAGDDGAISGTTFTSASADFAAVEIVPGMVLTTYTTIPSEGGAWEIVAVDSATTLTISLLRNDPAGTALAPPTGSDLKFHVLSFAPQIRQKYQDLAERLRMVTESAGIDSADFVDSSQLRSVIAHGALAAIFTARAENATARDANWIKAEYYTNQFRRLQVQLRMAVDLDGDGVPEQTRTLGNVRLRRV